MRCPICPNALLVTRKLSRRMHAIAVSVASLLVLSPVVSASDSPFTFRLIAETVIDAAGLNFENGPFGTCINGQTFQEQAMATHAGYQYATYFHGSWRLGIARRELPRGEWERFHFDNYRIGHNDVHNVAVLGICPGDGTIHLAFDHHGHPLHYRVSQPGVAARPDAFRWESSLFGPITDTLDGTDPLLRVTYPMFGPAPHGGLLLYFRTGGSGDGDWHLTEYSPGKSRWDRPRRFLAKEGVFQGDTSRCAYPNGLQYDARGHLHVTWCWRETPDLKTNHDLLYAYSDDRGVTWRNNAGESVGRSGELPITVDSPGITVVPIAYRWGMMNQLTQDVDGRGRVHVILWQNPTDAPAPNHDLNAWRYFHYWRDDSGQWQSQRLPFFGRKPRLVVDEAGNALAVFNKGGDLEYHGQDHGGRLHIAAATAESRWTDWRVVYTSQRDYVGEPRVDVPRWRAERVLSVYVQQKPAQSGQDSPLWSLDFRPERTAPAKPGAR